jgi:hypothetical protein
MREPELPDEEVASVTRAYLLRRTGQPYPPGLEGRALGFVVSERRHSDLNWIIVSTAVTVIALGAIVVAFGLSHMAAPSPSHSAPVPTPQMSICTAASVHATLTPPGTATSTSANGVIRYTTDGVLFTNISSSGCSLERPSLMQVTIPSEMLTTDNLAKVPLRTFIAPGAAVTLEFGSQVGCSTFQAPLVAASVTLTVPNLGTLSLTGLELNLMCGPPIDLGMQPSPSAPPSASPSLSTATRAPLCLASQIQVSYLMGASGAAAGNTSIVLGIRDSSARPCELRGWPIVQFVAGNGAALPTREMQTTSNFFLSTSLQTVILQTGTALLQTTQPIGSAPLGSTQDQGYGFISIASDDILLPCETAASVRVVLPGMSASIAVSLRVPMAFPAGQVVCSRGRIQVLPVHR